MAKSKARKKREHTLRTEGRDVTCLRAAAGEFSTHERKTMTKDEKARKFHTKHKKRHLQDSYHEDSASLFDDFMNSCQEQNFSLAILFPLLKGLRL